MNLCCKRRCWFFLLVAVYSIIWTWLFAARSKWDTIAFWRCAAFLLGFFYCALGSSDWNQQKYWSVLLVACMDLVRLLHPMGSLTNNSGRKSHLYGIVHLCSFSLETTSWSKLKFKCNKYPLEITNNLSSLAELIVKRNQLHPLTDFADTWNQPEHYSPTYQWIIHVLWVKNQKKSQTKVGKYLCFRV